MASKQYLNPVKTSLLGLAVSDFMKDNGLKTAYVWLHPSEQSEKGELKSIEFEMVARILCVFHRERPEQFTKFFGQFKHIILDDPP